MNKDIRKLLLKYGEKEYAEFSGNLIPESKPLIGVRIPELRNIAKVIVTGDYSNMNWNEVLEPWDNDEFFEETMLRGMVIGYGSSREGDINKAFELLDRFICMVDNWSVCDSCCVSLTIFQKDRRKVWEYIQKYLYSDKEFQVRVALIILLDHFLKYSEDGKKISRRRTVIMDDITQSVNKEVDCEKAGSNFERLILASVNRPFYQGYYAQMAAAWLVAESFVTYPQETYRFLLNNNMDDFTYNKALSKICESKTPDMEVKGIIKHLKRRK